ncbi:MAG: hypothetical protein Q9214_006318, partial [Letrouitia sp. 1 TL-2023]
MSQKLTHLQPGFRSRGYTGYAALSQHMMKDGKKCSKLIEIYNLKNKSENTRAMIIATCNDCEKHGVNVSQEVLEIFTPDEKGRRKVRWEPARLVDDQFMETVE